ncbi:MAG: NADAR family protein [Bacteroidia bacterium]|nr:NADAR family protein [Bacteroidia bacterium]
MKYSRQWLINQLSDGQSFKFLFFWGHRPTRDGSISQSVFSQWWEGHAFEENGSSYATAEHYMMAGKARLFQDEEILEKILQIESPAEAKKLGRQVRNFDANLWDRHSQDIVVQGNYLKFSQHPELQEFLLNTQNRIIVEASPRDRIWGIGMGKDNPAASYPDQWRGRNYLGFCLMEVRDKLREDKVG